MTLAHAQENPNVLQTVSLLTAYCFDLRGLAPTQLINEWLGTFSALWIRLAVIEALYLGRYKAISVEHLLQFWQVKGQPNFHFSPEFEQMVSQRLPKSLVPLAQSIDTDYPVGKAKTLKVPVIKQANSLPNKGNESSPGAMVAAAVADPDRLDSQGTESESQRAESVVIPPPVVGKPTRTFLPSIEQFIPIAAESDLLSKLQLVLNQGSLAVNS